MENLNSNTKTDAGELIPSPFWLKVLAFISFVSALLISLRTGIPFVFHSFPDLLWKYGGLGEIFISFVFSVIFAILNWQAFKIANKKYLQGDSKYKSIRYLLLILGYWNIFLTVESILFFLLGLSFANSSFTGGF